MVKRLGALLLALFLGISFATEEILDFRVELTLLPGGHLEVSEDITARVEREIIRHGIYRDLLFRPIGSWGGFASPIRYRIEGAWLDGKPVPWHTRSSARGLRVYLGSPSSLAPAGVHRYTLRYRAAYASRARPGRGLLEWNLTGNDWTLPIRRVELQIKLPPGLDASDLEARVYYGPLGAGEAVTLQGQGRTLVYQHERTLPPGSGLTLIASWPLEALPVDSPPPDPLVLILALVLVFLVLYLVTAWQSLGRDPKTGAVIPRFHPPEKVSAAMAAYLMDRNLSPRVFAAALADLAARGFITVTMGHEPRITRSKPAHASERPPRELHAFLETLLPPGRSRINLNSANATIIENARGELARRLARFSAPYLRPNNPAALAGALVVMLALGGLAGRISGEFGAAFFAAIAALLYMTFASRALHAAALARERYALIPGLSPIRELLRMVVNLLFVAIVPLAGGFLLGLYTGMAVGFLAAALALAGALGMYLLPAFTSEGSEIWRHLLGLARYLGTTDAEELRRIGAPGDTPEGLRELYPYAIALGVESVFARRLERYLSLHPEHAPGVLLWSTDGQAYPHSGFASYSTGISRALQTAYARASNQTSSSGGGFSGGGAGGGGGGGW